MVASMVTLYKVFDVENPFMLIFKHVVESKGLNSLVSFVKYETEKKKWQKVDSFLIEFLTNLYHEAEAEQKALYHNFYEDFMKEISTCSRKSIQIIQTVLAEGLWGRISDNHKEVEVEKLAALQKIILKS